MVGIPMSIKGELHEITTPRRGAMRKVRDSAFEMGLSLCGGAGSQQTPWEQATSLRRED